MTAERIDGWKQVRLDTLAQGERFMGHPHEGVEYRVDAIYPQTSRSVRVWYSWGPGRSESRPGQRLVWVREHGGRS